MHNELVNIVLGTTSSGAMLYGFKKLHDWYKKNKAVELDTIIRRTDQDGTKHETRLLLSSSTTGNPKVEKALPDQATQQTALPSTSL